MQSLLDLLCSQLKNLLSQAGVNLLSSGSDRDNKKQEEGAETEKKDIRGDLKQVPGSSKNLLLPGYTLAFMHSLIHLHRFPALIRKQRTAELHLGDFLVFLRRVVSSKAIQSKMASPKWTEVLLNIAVQKCCSGRGPTAFSCQKQQRISTFSFSGVPLVGNLRTRLLALHVLEAVLPACETSMDDDQMTQVRR